MLFLSTFFGVFGLAEAGITEVNIAPGMPTINDSIIYNYGWSGIKQC